MKSALLVLATVGLVASLGAAPAAQEVTGGDDLVEEKGPFQGTWIHPDANIMRFDKILVWDAAFQFRDVDEPRNQGTTRGRMMQSADDLDYPIAEESRKKFEEVFVATFVKEFQNSKKFEVVDQAGPGTLIVRGGVLDIVSNVPPTARRSTVFLSSVGEGTFVFEMIDAETGLMQARVAERRRIQADPNAVRASGIPVNANTVWSEVELWTRSVARDLRRELDKAKKRAEKEAK